MIVASAVAGGADASPDVVTPWLLLALLFAVGTGQAWTSPTWQSLQPELVPATGAPAGDRAGHASTRTWRGRSGRRSAARLVAADRAERDVPGQRGVVRGGGVRGLAVAVRAAPGRRESSLPREHVVAAMRASGRYVRQLARRCGPCWCGRRRSWSARARCGRCCRRSPPGRWAWAPAATGCCWGASASARSAGRSCSPVCARALAPDPTLAVGVARWSRASALVLAEVHVGGAVAASRSSSAGCGWIVALATLNTQLPGAAAGLDPGARVVVLPDRLPGRDRDRQRDHGRPGRAGSA